MKTINREWTKVEDDLPVDQVYVKVRTDNMGGKNFIPAFYISSNKTWWSGSDRVEGVIDWQKISDPYRRTKRDIV